MFVKYNAKSQNNIKTGARNKASDRQKMDDRTKSR